MTKPARPGYRTTNWSAYSAALRRRGSLLVWLDREMAWLAPRQGKPGRPPLFSDEEDQKTVRWTVFPTNAIQFCLSIKGEGRPENGPVDRFKP